MENKLKHREAQKRYYLLHREQCYKNVAKWKSTHPENVKAIARKHYSSHKEVYRIRQDIWREKNLAYSSWRGMLTRCYNPNASNYKSYGGRGIEVKYKNYQEFLSDVGERPNKHFSIERIDNNSHYEIGNCRWATAKEQASNRRKKICL